jgi:hypothetical protein
MREKAKISVLCVGEMHNDPVSSQWLNKTINDLRSHNIPIIFCMEKPNLPINQAIYNLKNSMSMAKNFIIKYDLNRYYTYNLPLKFINDKNRELLILELRNIPELNKMYNLDKINIIHELIKNNEADEQKLIFLQKLKELNIPYIGIDNVAGEKGATKIEEILQHTVEQKRINDMVSNILNLAFPLLEGKGGVIICSTGMMHSHRLAANLVNHLQQNKIDNIELKVLTANLYSEYVEEIAYASIQQVNNTKNYDSMPIKELYWHIDCQNILIPQATLKNPEALDKIVNELIAHASTRKVEFIIPNMNTEKELSIINAGGSVVEYIPANNSAKISIASSVLKNNIRGDLGIDRQLIKFSSETSLRLEYLRKFTSATIEDSGNGKYLITFPQEQLEIIKSVVYNWESVRVHSNVDNNTKCL